MRLLVLLHMTMTPAPSERASERAASAHLLICSAVQLASWRHVTMGSAGISIMLQQRAFILSTPPALASLGTLFQLTGLTK